MTITYKRGGQFDGEALQKLNYFMRDWRRNAVVKIDPALFDLIWEMYRELGSQKPIHVICGHRSGATNEMLRHTRGGQAKGSKHISGQAIDLHFPDVNVKQLRNSALIRERGGVGYYPTSAMPFVHVDTGNVRHWPRLPRQELAILFPNGSSKVTPKDGRPLTKSDFRVAMAQLQEKGGELPIAVRARLRRDTTMTPLLAKLGGEVESPSPAKATFVAAVETQNATAKPPVMMASFAPSFPEFGGKAPARNTAPSLTTPAVSNRVEPTSTRADFGAELTSLTRDVFTPGGDLAPLEIEEDVASSPDYDEDHPDEADYQPFPILPFMSDTPVASMDLSDDSPDFSLAKVHVMFAEPKEMLDTRFRPGLQFAELFWAQRFRGTAINTALRRVDRDVATASAPAPASPVRTAQQNAK